MRDAQATSRQKCQDPKCRRGLSPTLQESEPGFGGEPAAATHEHAMLGGDSRRECNFLFCNHGTKTITMQTIVL